MESNELLGHACSVNAFRCRYRSVACDVKVVLAGAHVAMGLVSVMSSGNTAPVQFAATYIADRSDIGIGWALG